MARSNQLDRPFEPEENRLDVAATAPTETVTAGAGAPAVAVVVPAPTATSGSPEPAFVVDLPAAETPSTPAPADNAGEASFNA